MARALDDDASDGRRDADRQARVTQVGTLAELRRKVDRSEKKLSKHKIITRLRRTAIAAIAAALLAALGWTVVLWGKPSSFIKVDIVCGAVLVGAAILASTTDHVRTIDRTELEATLDKERAELHVASAFGHPPLDDRRQLYRADVAGLIEQYQADGRKYRRVHNVLQSLIMVGSTSTTTVAALDSGRKLTWQSLTLVLISFAITLAATFTGYYKFRERSYFAQQTADAIEEELNAVTLGVGTYHEFGPDQEAAALARFTQRVEELRNEQRRRQQQLDQPADQAEAAKQPAA